MDKVEIHRRATQTSAQCARKAVVGLPVETERRGEIDLVAVGYGLVEVIMSITYGQVERKVHPAHPVFKLRCRINCEIIGVDHILCQSGQCLRNVGQLRIHRAEITLYPSFKAKCNPLYVEGVCSALVCIEGVVGDVLAESLTAYVQIQRLRQRLPFVHALERYKMLPIEAFYHLELVGDMVIR